MKEAQREPSNLIEEFVRKHSLPTDCKIIRDLTREVEEAVKAGLRLEKIGKTRNVYSFSIGTQSVS